MRLKILTAILLGVFGCTTSYAQETSRDLTPELLKNKNSVNFILEGPNNSQELDCCFKVYSKKGIMDKSNFLYDSQSELYEMADTYNCDIYALEIKTKDGIKSFYFPVKYTKYYYHNNQIQLKFLTDENHPFPNGINVPAEVNFYIGLNNSLYFSIRSQLGALMFQDTRVVKVYANLKDKSGHLKGHSTKNAYTMLECFERVFKNTLKKM